LKVDTTGSAIFLVNEPTGVDLHHSIDGVKGALKAARLRAGYLQVQNGKRLEPVWDIEVTREEKEKKKEEKKKREKK
jgi:hypothetical protein